MGHSTLWDTLQLGSRSGHEEMIDLLRNCAVFHDIGDRGLQVIRGRCHLRQYKENEHVFRAGEPGVGMYIILEGSVEIYRNEGSFRRQFAVMEAGDFFGEIALLEDLPRTASAKARSYCRVMGFFRPDLLSLLSRKPRLASVILMNMARLTARRLLNTNSALEELQTQLDETNTGSESVVGV
ncbi:MAG: cyclic nucleotide-binding domain-containing protein [Spirochaetales bacterium]|nr:cyclic nucleotide-binding domain-containing protein [Leptospiraceae bacterium]MCP5480917.1 cyclic nucleotide-binding domain-containing protein [Spirochaetales bacterium]MCP5485297.1 cyclic nucleotide-binding domain-containing protein [Spirochaetales bacterium]